MQLECKLRLQAQAKLALQSLWNETLEHPELQLHAGVWKYKI
jgi:hypothetical protein